MSATGAPHPPRPPSAAAAGAGALPPPAARLALFRLGRRLCGVASSSCKQFVHLDAVTPVPLAPGCLLGVAQLRGRILPVIDAVPLLAPPPGNGGFSAAPARPAAGAPPPGSAAEAPPLESAAGDDRTPPSPGPTAGDGRTPLPPALTAGGGGLVSTPPPAGEGAMPALVVSVGGLGSTLAALRVTEIVGFEHPSPALTAGGPPRWQGEEVAVLDVAALVARVARLLATAPRPAPAGERGWPPREAGWPPHEPGWPSRKEVAKR
jgi:hypothetical protein